MNIYSTHNDENSNSFTSTIAVGLSTAGINKFKDFAKLSRGKTWDYKSVRVNEFIAHVCSGYPWMPAKIDNSQNRRQKNCNYTEVIAIDVDNSPSLDYLPMEEAVKIPFIKEYALAVIPTASSTLEHHKYRVIFSLPIPIEGNEKISWLNARLQKELPFADPSCKDSSRFFYGAQGAEPFFVAPKNKLPRQLITQWLSEYEQEIEAAATIATSKSKDNHARNARFQELCASTTEVNQDLFDLLAKQLSYIPVRKAGTNTYNTLYLPIIGGLVNSLGEQQAMSLLTAWDGGRGEWGQGVTIQDKVRSFANSQSGNKATTRSLWYLAVEHGWEPTRQDVKLVFGDDDSDIQGIKNPAVESRAGVIIQEFKESSALKESVKVASFEAAIQIIAQQQEKNQHCGTLVLLKAPIGSGKSQVAKHFVDKYKSEKKASLSFARTCALATEQSGKYNLYNYQDGNIQQKSVINQGIVISLDSLTKLSALADFNPHLLIGDEIHTIPNHINTAPTAVKSKRHIVRLEFEKQCLGVLNRGGLILCLSADLTGFDVSFMESITNKKALVIEVQVAPQGNKAIVLENKDELMAQLKGDVRNTMRQWRDSGYPPESAPFFSILTDSKRLTNSSWAFLSGDYVPVEFEDKDEWSSLYQPLHQLIDEFKHRICVKVINANTVGLSDNKKFLRDISGSVARNASQGLATILIASPTIQEGVSMVIDVPHSSYVLMNGVLPPRDAIQMLKRDRNPNLTYIWVNPMAQNRTKALKTMAELKDDALTASSQLKNDSLIVQKAASELAFRQFSKWFQDNFGKSIELASSEEVWKFAGQKISQDIMTFGTTKVLDAMSYWFSSDSPWSIVDYGNTQFDAIERMDWDGNFRKRLIENGFEIVSDKDAQPLFDVSDPVVKDGLKQAKEATVKMDSRWMLRGFQNMSYDNEEQILEQLNSESKDVSQKQMSILMGALFRIRYPNVELDAAFAESIVKDKMLLNNFRKYWIAKNPDYLQDLFAKDIAFKAMSTVGDYLVSDIANDSKTNLKIQLLLELGILDLVGKSFHKDSPEVVAIVNKAKKNKKLVSALISKKLPNNSKMRIRWISELLNEFNIRLKLVNRSVKKGNHLRIYSCHLHPRTEEMLMAMDIYYSGKREDYEAKKAHADEMKQILETPKTMYRTYPGNPEVQTVVVDEMDNEPAKVNSGDWLYWNDGNADKLAFVASVNVDSDNNEMVLLTPTDNGFNKLNVKPVDFLKSVPSGVRLHTQKDSAWIPKLVDGKTACITSKNEISLWQSDSLLSVTIGDTIRCHTVDGVEEFHFLNVNQNNLIAVVDSFGVQIDKKLDNVGLFSVVQDNHEYFAHSEQILFTTDGQFLVNPQQVNKLNLQQTTNYSASPAINPSMTLTEGQWYALTANDETIKRLQVLRLSSDAIHFSSPDDMTGDVITLKQLQQQFSKICQLVGDTWSDFVSLANLSPAMV